MNPIKQYLNLFKKEPQILSLGLAHTFFSGFGQTFFLSLLVPPIMLEYSLTRSEWGFWYSLLTLAAALSMFFVGPLIDTKDLKHYSLYGGITLLVATLLGFWSPNFYVLILALFLVRFAGQGLLSHIAQTTTSRYFTTDRGKALGLISLGYPFSEMILPILAALILSPTGWRSAFVFMAALILFVFIPLTQILLKPLDRIRFNHDRHDNADQKKSHKKASSASRLELIKDFKYWCYLPVAVTPPFLITGFFIHQNSLNEILTTWNKSSFALAISFFAIFRGLGSLFIGPLIDKWGAKPLLVVYTLPIATGALFAAFVDSNLTGTIFFSLCGTTAGIGGSIKSATLVEVWGATHLGAIRSMTGTFMVLSTALSPWFFGALLDNGLGFDQLLWASSLLCLFTLSLAYFGLVKPQIPLDN